MQYSRFLLYQLKKNKMLQQDQIHQKEKIKKGAL